MTKESNAIFLKSEIALPFEVKKKIEIVFLKGLDAHVLEVDLTSKEMSKCKNEDDEEDFSDDE